jgi:hypothetical protein
MVAQLLRQPGGFKGADPVGESLDPDDPSIAYVVERRPDLIDLDLVRSAPHPHDHRDLITSVEEFLRLDVVLIPGRQKFDLRRRRELGGSHKYAVPIARTSTGNRRSTRSSNVR